MPQIAADLQPRCSPQFPHSGIEESQIPGPDPNLPRACPRARDANGRFAKGCSGNPRGRPRGIPNPRRRPLGLLLRQARPGTLPDLIDRKPHLQLPLLRLILPERARQPDPGDLLGIDFSRMRSSQEIAAAMGRVVGAMCRGDIMPGDAARLARRSRKPLRAIRRAQWRELAELKALQRGAKRAGKVGARATRPPDAAGTATLGPDNVLFRPVFGTRKRGKSRAWSCSVFASRVPARVRRRDAMFRLRSKRAAEKPE